jgi:hypothetical protein
MEKPTKVNLRSPRCGGEEDGNLFLPGGAAERISVDENDGIAGAVVLIIKVDVG